MSFQFPDRSTRQWVVSHQGDSFGVLIGTKNLNMDNNGYVTLGERAVALFDNDDDSAFDNVVSVQMFNDTIQAATDDHLYTINPASDTQTENTTSGAATSIDDIALFNGALYTTQTATAQYLRKLSTGGSWSSISGVISTANTRHPLAVDIPSVCLCVGDGNTVKRVTTSDTVANTCTIPVEYTVTSIATNGTAIYIGTKVASGNAALFVWDGTGSAAQAHYPVNARYIYAVRAYQSSVALLTSSGELLRFNGGGFDRLGGLPVFFQNIDWAMGSSSLARQRSLVANGDLLFLNLSSRPETNTYVPDKSTYAIDRMPSGVWCYDPDIGLYHRAGPSYARRKRLSVASASINTSTDAVSSSTKVYTGQPVIFQSPDHDATATVGGLTSDTLYYAINVDGTHFKLATTRSNAQAGTAIDLTSVTSSATFYFYVYPETDFGAYLADDCWAVQNWRSDVTSAYTYYEVWRLLFGATMTSTIDLTQRVGCLNTLVSNVPNRGYFITSKVQADAVTDQVPRLYVRFAPLVTEEDKIIVKYRVAESANLPVRFASVSWVSGTQFTTTDTRFANVLAGDEVEVLEGRAAGCLAHVSSISGPSGGTYTVDLDETLPEVALSLSTDVSRVTVERWTKAATITTSTPTNAKGYADVPLAARSGVFCQLKVELRGANVMVREVRVEGGPDARE